MQHPALWMITQLMGKLYHPTMRVAIRCVHNAKPYEHKGKMVREEKCTFNETIKLEDFQQRWHDDLFQHLTMLNMSPTEPSNVYFGVNARLTDNNKAENIAGYGALYLDLDDNKSYTLEQRNFQIEFWRDYNLSPSFVVNSGRGRHVYWLLDSLVKREIGQPVLKMMVAMSGCKDGGNTHDVTRILRLPGFKNQKNWYNGDSPECALIAPADYENCDEALRYSLTTFQEWFPPSESGDIAKYHQAAVIVGADDDIRAQVRAAAQAAQQLELQQRAIRAGSVMMDHKQAVRAQAAYADAAENMPGSQGTEAKAPWTPTRELIPPVDDIKWKRGKLWMRMYCKKGWDGLDDDEKNEIEKKINQSVSGSELDYRIMYFLVEQGYTFDAAIEFWMRQDLRLFREEKLAKNPNYLAMTYEKCLEQVRNVVEQKTSNPTLDEQQKSKVIIKARNTFMVRTNGNAEHVLTGELILLSRYLDADATIRQDREWFEVRCFTFAGGGEVDFDMLLPGEAFSSLSSFKRHVCGENLRCLSNDNADLQRILHHLEQSYPDTPLRKFHSKITCKNKQYVFPKFTITKGGIALKEDFIAVEEISRRVPVYQWFEAKVMSVQEGAAFAREYWPKLLKIHLPRLVISILGTIGAAALKPLFEQELGVEDFNLPSVNIRGSSHCGKSETVKRLMKMACICKGLNTVSTQTSAFALQRVIELTNFVPIVIDEFKLERDNSNAKNLEFIRGLLRRMYTGEAVMRGKADLSLVSFRLNAPLIILGEHAVERVGDVAEMSRIIPIDCSEYEPDKHVINYLQLREQPFQRFAPLFYQWLLNQDLQSLLHEFSVLVTEIITGLKGSFAGERLRVGHNIAVLMFGCRLWDKFITSIAPGTPTIEEMLHPTVNLLGYIKEQAISSGQSLQIMPDNPAETPTVVANNEFFEMMTTFVRMVENRNELIHKLSDRPVFIFHEQEKLTSLHVRLPVIHELYAEYLRKQGKHAAPYRKITQLVESAHQKGERWVARPSHVKTIYGTHQRVATLNLRAMRDMKCWFDAESASSRDYLHGMYRPSTAPTVEDTNML